MPWFKIDDTLHSHPKSRAAGAHAMGLWAMSGAYSSAYKLDGFVPRDYVTTWPQGVKLADRLVASNYWHPDGQECDCLPERRRTGGWYFHDWSDYQVSAEEIERDREMARERQRRRREALRQSRKEGSDAP